MNLETKITIYKFTPQLFTLTQFQPVFFETESIRIPPCKADKYFYRDTISLYQYIYDSDREAEYETIEVDGEPYSRKSVEIALYNTGLQELENKLVKLGKSEEKGKTETPKDEIAKMNELFGDVSIV